MAGETIKWGFEDLADNDAFLAWQTANPTFPIINVQRLKDGSIHVVYGTVVAPAAGKRHFMDDLELDQVTAFQTTHPTYIMLDIIRRVDGRVMIVYIIPA